MKRSLILVFLATVAAVLALSVRMYFPFADAKGSLAFASAPAHDSDAAAREIAAAMRSAIGVADIRKSLEGIDWIEYVSAREIYPDRIEVVVRPKTIIGSVLDGGRYFGVSDSGEVVRAGLGAPRFPLVEGRGGAEALPSLPGELAAVAGYDAEFVLARRVDMIRWDLVLRRGNQDLLLRLPPERVLETLEKIAGLRLPFESVSVLDARAEPEVFVMPRAR